MAHLWWGGLSIAVAAVIADAGCEASLLAGARGERMSSDLAGSNDFSLHEFNKHF